MPSTVIPSSDHLSESDQQVLIHSIEEWCNQFEELILVEYSLDIAIEAFHDLII